MENKARKPRPRIRDHQLWKEYVLAIKALDDARAQLVQIPGVEPEDCPTARVICESVMLALGVIGDTLRTIEEQLEANNEGDWVFSLADATTADEYRAVSGHKCDGVFVDGEDLANKTCRESLKKLADWLEACTRVL